MDQKNWMMILNEQLYYNKLKFVVLGFIDGMYTKVTKLKLFKIRRAQKNNK